MRTSKSPDEIPKAPLMHRRYMPTAASTMPNHVPRSERCPHSKAISGTITTYNPVVKPALPAVVVMIPICCSDDARPRTTPASIAPSSIARPDRRLEPVVIASRRGRERITNGTSTTLPRQKRTALNVKGPTCSMPARCATNAKPQMAAARSRVRLALSLGLNMEARLT